MYWKNLQFRLIFTEKNRLFIEVIAPIIETEIEVLTGCSILDSGKYAKASFYLNRRNKVIRRKFTANYRSDLGKLENRCIFVSVTTKSNIQ